MACKDAAGLSNPQDGTWDNGTTPEVEPSAKKQKSAGPNGTPNRAGSSANPCPQRWGPPHTYSTQSDKIICVMVGLPARGKSYISRRLSQYLSFFYNVPCKMFNVGDYRRKAAGNLFQDADFFNTNNATAMALRREATEAAMLDLCSWMKGICTEPKALRNADGSPRSAPPGAGHTFVSGDFGAVAMFDATNTTRERRRWLIERSKETGAKVIFIESILTDEEVITKNIVASKVGVKDYSGIDAEQAVADFRERIAHYESVYESVSEKDLSWIKLIDGGREMACNNIRGFLPTRIMTFLVNLHMQRSPFYLTRHGQSEYNEYGQIGGDSGLTERGEEYATALGKWVTDNVACPNGVPQPARLWTSTMRRTVQTARHISHQRLEGPGGVEWINMRPKAFKNLDEIYAGVCDGMMYEEVAQIYPEEAEARKANKFAYRYPRGESYIDLIARLEPIAHEMERQREPLLVVAHQAILRVLYAYFSGLAREDCVAVSIPLNTVIKIKPTAQGFDEERFHPIEPESLAPHLLDPASH